jgi:anti-sigma-K factor RskA
MSEIMREQAVAYLLRELGAAERLEFERRLAAEPALRAEVERLEPVVVRLRELPPESWEAEPPPLQLPGAEPALRPRPAGESGWLSGLLRPRRIALAGAAALALFAGGIVVGSQLSEDSGGEPAVASIQLEPLPGSQGATGAVELAGGDTQSAELVVDGLPPNEPGTYYELWLLREDETFSLGSFTVGADGGADASVPIPVDPGRYELFDISVEREDGDPAHSGDSVLRGPTSSS